VPPDTDASKDPAVIHDLFCPDRPRSHPALRTVLDRVASLVTEIHPAASRMRSDHPFVEFSTMYNAVQQEMLLHAVDYDVSIDGEVGETSGVRVQVALPPGKRAADVRYSGDLRSFRNVPAETASIDGRTVVTVELDSLGIYSLVRIQLE